MKRLILIRHGRTEANDCHLYCGSTDIPLSQAGREELLELKLHGEYPCAVGVKAYTSGMLRTKETLEILYGISDADSLPAMREVDFGRFEMHSYEELKDDPAYMAWCSGDNESNIPPGGESGTMMTARVLKCLSELVSQPGDALVVCHGGVIAAVMAELFPNEGKNRYEWQPKGGHGYIVTFSGSVADGYTAIPQ